MGALQGLAPPPLPPLSHLPRPFPCAQTDAQSEAEDYSLGAERGCAVSSDKGLLAPRDRGRGDRHASPLAAAPTTFLRGRSVTAPSLAPPERSPKRRAPAPPACCHATAPRCSCTSCSECSPLMRRRCAACPRASPRRPCASPAPLPRASASAQAPHAFTTCLLPRHRALLLLHQLL
jgi:hypothetical protein